MFDNIICWLIEKLGMGRQKWESDLDPLWTGLGMPIILDDEESHDSSGTETQ